VSDLEQRWNDLGEFIREQRRSGQLSLRKLSELAGISNPYLSQVERGLRRPSADILQRIAKALEISSETLYVRAGILDEPTADDLVDHIRRDRWLTEDQKRTLIHVYQTFRTGPETTGDTDSTPSVETADPTDDPGSDAA
jgi:transcriptional regulator with XRE-family HTH domain